MLIRRGRSTTPTPSRFIISDVQSCYQNSTHVLLYLPPLPLISVVLSLILRNDYMQRKYTLYDIRFAFL